MALQEKADALLRAAVAEGQVPGVVALATGREARSTRARFGERVLGGGAR